MQYYLAVSVLVPDATFELACALAIAMWPRYIGRIGLRVLFTHYSHSMSSHQLSTAGACWTVGLKEMSIATGRKLADAPCNLTCCCVCFLRAGLQESP